MATKFSRNTNSSSHIEMMPARPGVRDLSLDSSLRLSAVSQPQKKNTPSAMPAAIADHEWMAKGLSHPRWNEVDPWGWVARTLMIPPMENPMTTTYSMITRIHWKLVVQRMP